MATIGRLVLYLIIIFVAVISFAGMQAGKNASAVDPNNLRTHKESTKFGWVYDSEIAVKSIMKDPKSAQFRDVYISYPNINPKSAFVCGEVNAKNSFGAYDGFERFVSQPSINLVMMKKSTKDFYKYWNKYCLNP